MAVYTPPSVLWWGEGRGAAGPRYWQAADVASDDGVANSLLLETNPVAPDGLGGEVAFTTVYVTVTAGASAVLKVTPIVDDVEPVSTTTPDGAVLSVVSPTMTVPQQTGGPPVPTLTQTFQVPLLLQLVRSGQVKTRWYPRGARCAIRIETQGAIGTGPFRIDGIELEYETLRNVQRGTISIPTTG